MRKRYLAGLMFLAITGILVATQAEVFGVDPSPVVYAPPQLTNITPVSFLAQWYPLDVSNATTHYQIRINGMLYGASTRQTEKSVFHLISGTNLKIDYVIYHNGKIHGVSSSVFILMPPAKPADLYADQITTSSFRLTWTPTVSTDKYFVYADDEFKSTVQAASVPRVTLTGFEAGKRVKATVVGNNSTGNSFTSDPLYVTLLPPPPSLTVAISDITQTTFVVKWNLIPDVSTYTVLKNDTEYASVGSQTHSLTVAGCTPGATTSAAIRAFNISGASEISSTVYVLTIPDTPATPTASNIGTNSFDLTWLAVAGATGHKVYRDEVWLLYNLPTPLDTVKCNRGFNPGETASMTITSYNSTGESPHSPIAAVKLLEVVVASLTDSIDKTPGVTFPERKLPIILLEDSTGKGWDLSEIVEPSKTTMIGVFSRQDTSFNNYFQTWQKIMTSTGGSEIRFLAMIVIPKDSENPGFVKNTYFVRDENLPQDFPRQGFFILGSDGKIRKTESGMLWMREIDAILSELRSGSPGAETLQKQFESLHSIEGQSSSEVNP